MLQQTVERDPQMEGTFRHGGQPFYTMIDLFAGCGGLSLGFECAGFTPVFVNELDKDAMTTYLQNRRHMLGGLAFAENEALRCYDIQNLKGGRLDALISDLQNIPEANFIPYDTANAGAGGGSSLDVLAGGPPCQGFSGIGIRRSYPVDRKEIPSNRLFSRMAQVIKRLRPRIFLFENVRGLLNAKWTRYGDEFVFQEVKAEFDKIPGYEVRWSLVFAKNYGVPQNRPRVLLVGIRKDLVAASALLDPANDPEDAVACRFLPTGKAGAFPHLSDLLGDLIDPKTVEVLRSGDFPSGAFETTSYPKSARTAIQKRFRRPPPWNLTGRTKLTEQQYSKHSRAVVEKFDYMISNNGEIPERFKTKKFSQRVLKAKWGNEEPNFTAACLADDYVHYAQPRSLTVREWARIQMFPDWYRFAGKRTTGGLRRAGNPRERLFDREVPKYTQIGNAVPVGLAEAVAEHFKMLLDDALGKR
ncbi:MAG: DNA cytosine methyltransferase [Albidovulum sp.]|nr:DNA cytosine methyltransferase [Albidovulum sp.]